MKKSNKPLCFIGMSGIGKSSFGKLLAKKYQRHFIDTDDLIEETIATPIKTYLLENSEKSFLTIEEQVILAIIIPNNSIIATGGSVIYNKNIMTFLKYHCTLIYLKDSLENIQNRINNYENRGIIMNNHKTLEAVYQERLPLYEQWQDITISYPSPFSIKNIVTAIDTAIKSIQANES
tara:strand:+ start:1205 stop:1738 length:534 start_codon:yes stop_codon:yes gene_type:complete